MATKKSGTDAAGIQWAEPPGQAKGPAAGVRYNALVKELREHPGQWAVALRGMSSSGAGRYALRIRGCETTVRHERDRTWTIYARWPSNGDG